MKKPLTVGVLFGGPSEEYEVSRKSAQTVMRGLREAGFEAVAIGIARHGRWYGPVEEADIADFDPVENAPGEGGMMPRNGLPFVRFAAGLRIGCGLSDYSRHIR